MRRTTLTSAHSTTGQRAISRITPRQDSFRPPGWNQRRVQHHITLEVSGTGRKYRRKELSLTGAIGRCVKSAIAGRLHRSPSESDHSVYQL